MRELVLVYEAPSYWKSDAPCNIPDLVAYVETTELFRWPGFLQDRFPSKADQTLVHLGETFTLRWKDAHNANLV